MQNLGKKQLSSLQSWIFLVVTLLKYKMNFRLIIVLLIIGCLAVKAAARVVVVRGIKSNNKDIRKTARGRASDETTQTSSEEEDSEEDEGNPDPFQSICNRIPAVSPEDSHPLKCYHCSSHTRKEKNPHCDAILWKYLKHSEKARLRLTCGPKGKFCVKIVKKKYLERITERGCFTDSILGPKDTIIKTQNGCISHKKDGYLVTVCFCDKNFCNGAQSFKMKRDILSFNFYSLVFLGILFQLTFQCDVNFYEL